MNRFSLKNKILMVNLLIMFLILGVGVLIILPAVKRVNDLRSIVELSERQVEQNYQKSRLLKRSIRELDKVKTDMEKFRQSVISKQDELRTITLFEQIAESNGVVQNLNVVLVDDREKKVKPHYLFTFQVDGEFNHLVRYLSDLEKIPPYLIIDRLSWLRSSKSDGISLNFTGKVYIK